MAYHVICRNGNACNMGFLGFGNYSKPGKGVKKDTEQKKRFFEFGDVFFRKFSKLIQLNLVFLIYCIPAIIVGAAGVYISGVLIASDSVFSLVSSAIVIFAIGLTGPAMAGLVKICRYYTEEKPVFLMSDYFKAVKENFKQSLLMGIINSALSFVLYQSFIFYIAKASTESWFYWIPLVLIMSIALIAVMANFYTYLVIVSVSLPLRQVIKNSISFAFLGLKTNIITFVIVIGVVVASIFVPLVILLALILTFSFCGLVIAFNSFQYVYRYSIRPYYVVNNLPNPYEPEEEDATIFEDAT